MYFRCTISASALFCLLVIAVAGCDRFDQANAPEASTLKTDDSYTHYEQLLRKRLEIEEKIFDAMELFHAADLKVREQRARLREQLGDKSISETIELFGKSKAGNEIPSDLRVAYSIWRTLMPDETQRLQIVKWIDKQQFSGVLEDFDNRIKEIENRRQLGKILGQEDIAEIDRLIAQPVVGYTEDVREKIDNDQLEKEAMEQLKADLAH